MKCFRILAVLCLATIAAQAQTLAVTPASASLGEGASQSFTANKPVTWSLPTGAAGTLNVIDSTHASYTAPAAIHYVATIAGCPVAPNDSIFTTRIDSLPVDPRTPNWTNTANIGTNTLSFDTAWGISLASNATPLKTETFYYTTTYDGPWLLPTLPALKRENGTYVSDKNESDHHTLAVNTDTCQFWETYNDFLSGARDCRDGSPGCTAISGYSYSGTSYALATDGTTDAAGLPLGPLTLHLDELLAGAVQHALRFTLAGGYIQADNVSFLWPATEPHFGVFSPNSPLYGARYRLKASYDISGFSTMAQAILLGLQRYGMILADAGTGPSAVLSSDLSRNNAALDALGAISDAHIPLSQFEVVDETSLMISPTSSQVKVGSASAQYGAITATDTSTSPATVLNVSIALQGITVAVPDPMLYLAAGNYNYQLSASVHGSTNQSVTWSLVSGVGAVTAGGLYTPPASVTSPSSAVLRATSAADATATVTQSLIVLPVDATGTLRIDAGLTDESFTDATGAVWWMNQGFEAGDYTNLNGDWPHWQAQTNPEIGVYQSQSYTYGSDIEYRLIMPNGLYKVRFMFGQAYNGNPVAGCTLTQTEETPQNLEIQGVVVAAAFVYGAGINGACATPVDFVGTGSVTNHQLLIAARPVTNDSWMPTAVATLNGLEISFQSPLTPPPPPTPVTTPIVNVPGATKLPRPCPTCN